MKTIKFFCLVLLLQIVSFSFAIPVSFQRAKTVAIKWYSTHAPVNVFDFSIQNVDTKTEAGFTSLYIFNFNAGGCVIVAADDRLHPIVGYSYTTSFNLNLAGSVATAWLNHYSKLFVKASNTNLSWPNALENWSKIENSSGSTREITTGVSSLLANSSNWGYWAPYYDLNPPVLGVDYVGNTACVAMATARIMKYYNWPPRGSCSHINTYGGFADFSQSVYDYANMPFELNHYDIATGVISEIVTLTDYEKYTVQKLLYDCTIAVDLEWGHGTNASKTITGSEARTSKICRR